MLLTWGPNFDGTCNSDFTPFPTGFLQALERLAIAEQDEQALRPRMNYADQRRVDMETFGGLGSQYRRPYHGGGRGGRGGGASHTGYPQRDAQSGGRGGRGSRQVMARARLLCRLRGNWPSNLACLFLLLHH